MKENIIAVLIVIVATFLLSSLMAFCIDDMSRNHKDYKGEDFLK